MSQEAGVRVIRRDAFLEITLTSPQTGNKLTRPLLACIEKALQETDDAICAMLLRNEGSVFCQGGDLGDYRQQDAGDVRAFGDSLTRALLAIHQCAVPVIAWINGTVAGGGFSLVEACDMAVCTPESTFAIPEILGGLPPVISFSGACRAIPQKKLMQMALTGSALTATEALALGIVTDVKPPSEAQALCAEWISELSNRSPSALRMVKELRRQMDGYQYDRQLRDARDLLVQALLCSDAKAALDMRDLGQVPRFIRRQP